MRKVIAAAAFFASTIVAANAQANEFSAQISAFFESNIKPKLTDPVVVEAIKRQNGEHGGLVDSDIESMDQTWRAEAKAGGGSLIDKVMTNELSAFLKQIKAAHPDAVTEVFIMDNRGLNVGQSDVTSDYNQGDESKWQKTYAVGPSAIFIDDVEFDESTESFQSQVSGTIVDPATGEAIGAITVGLNVENLL
mgnify:CR=1 FL=1